MYGRACLHGPREEETGAAVRSSLRRSGGLVGYKLGIDVGGTFTDFVAVNGDAAGLFKGKVPTRPRDEATSVLEAVGAISSHFGADTRVLLDDTEYIVL